MVRMMMMMMMIVMMMLIMMTLRLGSFCSYCLNVTLFGIIMCHLACGWAQVSARDCRL